MAGKVLTNKSKEFAKKIIILCEEIQTEKKETVLSSQLMLSGISIGLHIHETQYTQDYGEHISQFIMAQKQCYETEYRLVIMHESGYIADEPFESLKEDCGSLLRMLMTSIIIAKSREHNPK